MVISALAVDVWAVTCGKYVVNMMMIQRGEA